MVTSEDIVVAYSNSGETAEIVHILPSLRRIGARIIAVVGHVDSTWDGMPMYTGRRCGP